MALTCDLGGPDPDLRPVSKTLVSFAFSYTNKY